MTKVCMITTNHSPFDDRIFYKEAKSLKKAGYDVTVIGQTDSKMNKVVDEIRIVGIEKIGPRPLGQMLLILKLLIQSIKARGNIYHCHEPDSLMVGVVVKILLRKKLIYDVHEHYPSQISSRYNGIFKTFLKSTIEFIERFSCMWIDFIIVAPPNLKNRFQKEFDKENVEIIYVCPSLEIFNTINDKICEKYSKDMIIVYEGNVDKKYRGLDIFLKTLNLLVKKYPDIKFLVVGKILEGDEFFNWINDYLTKNNLSKNFEITEWVDYELVPSYLYASNIGVILLQPVSYNNIIGTPNKLFDYMAARIPIVASDFPNITRIVKGANCGILVNPTDPEKITDAITFLLEHPDEAKRMGESGRRAVEEKYSWEKMEERLFEVYEGLK